MIVPGQDASERLAKLTALRDVQEGLLLSDGLPAREVAALSREYRATLAEIEELAPPAKAGDPVDEIAARRAARRPGAASDQARAKRPV